MAITVEREGGRATLLIDNPPVNAVDRATYLAFFDAFTIVEEDPGIGLVVVAATGRTFCAGADLREIEATDPAEKDEFATWRRWAVGQLHSRLAALPAATIAAVNGPALGVGCMIAAACDFRFASTRASFGLPEVRLGVKGGARELESAGLVTGWHRYLVLTGEAIDASTAAAAGLVQRVLPPEELTAVVDRLSERMLAQGPAILRETKQALLA